MKNVEDLRKEAERARRLLNGVSDPLSRTLMTEYAAECDAQADRLERGEPVEAPLLEDPREGVDPR